ncbi:hypothetical protein [Usitatibacter rugosus]|nr:hypothetical protein [Usitatibacter rugosus]
MITRMNRPRRTLLLSTVVLLAGCAGPGSRQQSQAIEIANVGSADLRNVQFQYANAFDIDRSVLGPRARVSRFEFSPVPDAAYLSWIPSDGRQRSLAIPIRGVVPDSMDGKGLLFEIDEGSVQVYLSQNLLNFSRKERIFPP